MATFSDEQVKALTAKDFQAGDTRFQGAEFTPQQIEQLAANGINLGSQPTAIAPTSPPLNGDFRGTGSASQLGGGLRQYYTYNGVPGYLDIGAGQDVQKTIDQLESALKTGGKLPANANLGNFNPAGTIQGAVAKAQTPAGIDPITGASTSKAQSPLTLTPSVITSSQAKDATLGNQTYLNQTQPPATSTGGQSYTVKSGDTLSAIAKQFGVPISSISGYKSGDINKIGVGEVLTIGGNQPTITASSANNPALNSLIQQANSLIQQMNTGGGKLDPSVQAQIDAINQTAGYQAILNAKATTANNTGDYKGLNDYVSELKASEKTLNDQMTKLFTELSSKRSEISALTQKSGEEKTIETQLADLRNNATKSNLNIASQPIPMTFIVGQQREQTKVYQAEEANLLTRLGLAQEDRQAKLDTAKAELGYIKDDIELQFKIQDRLIAEQDRILAQADKLDAKSRQKLADILTMLDGVNPSKLTPQEQAQISTLAASQGLDVGMVLKSLEAAYNQKTFDNSIKTITANKTTASQNPDRLLTLAEQQAYGKPAGTTLSEVTGIQPLSTTTRGTLNQITNAIPLIDTVGGLVDKLGLATDTKSTFSRGTVLKAESLVPSTPAGQYAAQSNAFVSLITRALGEKGTLATGDIERIKNALPGFYDTTESAANKLNTLREIMNDVYQKTLGGYYDTPAPNVTSSGDVLGLGIKL